MATGSEQSEYSSAVKRRKIDLHIVSTSPALELDFRIDNLTERSPAHDFEEVISADSGFVEMSDGLKSNSSSSIDTTNSSTDSTTPTRTDSTSDDTGCPLDTADEKDEVSSTVSNLSDLSGLSELSGKGDSNQHWRSASTWIQKQILTGIDPRDIHQIIMDSNHVPQGVDEFTLWKIIMDMMNEPPRRQKLRHINTLSDVVRLIRESENIIVLSGAGISVSCGIPDFRSRDGIYRRLAEDFPDLPDPQAMFDINYFAQDPRPFFKFAREIYPGQFKPSPCHRFIKVLEKQKKLLRNYSQNIDTLEQVAGIEKVIECHGSFATASCTRCKHQVKADDIREDIFAQRIPLCPKCSVNSPLANGFNPDEHYKDLVSLGIMKPDIVFFGEGLPNAFHEAMSKDKDDCELLIVIGSSLKVRPVALIPSSLPPDVPQILINRESLPHLKFDVELLGDGDVIINQLCHMLEEEDYKEVIYNDKILTQAKSLLPAQISTDDTWEQSQESNHVSQDSVNMNTITSQKLTPESQMNSTQCEAQIAGISPFHAGHMETNDSGFGGILNESPKRRLSDCSVESSPKRMNFGDSNINDGISNNSDEKSTDECHVVPKIDDNIDKTVNELSFDNAVVEKRVNGNDMENKVEETRTLERNCWQFKRESLSARLPENAYYQLLPGKYIFQGAELYSNEEDYEEERSSESDETPTSSEIEEDSSSSEEEHCGEDDLSEVAEGDQEGAPDWTNVVNVDELPR